jgi:hypothetical protein
VSDASQSSFFAAKLSGQRRKLWDKEKKIQEKFQRNIEELRARLEDAEMSKPVSNHSKQPSPICHLINNMPPHQSHRPCFLIMIDACLESRCIHSSGSFSLIRSTLDMYHTQQNTVAISEIK